MGRKAKTEAQAQADREYGERLRAAITGGGHPLSEVAAYAEVSVQSIRSWMAGSARPRATAAGHLRALLGVDPPA